MTENKLPPGNYRMERVYDDGTLKADDATIRMPLNMAGMVTTRDRERGYALFKVLPPAEPTTLDTVRIAEWQLNAIADVAALWRTSMKQSKPGDSREEKMAHLRNEKAYHDQFVDALRKFLRASVARVGRVDKLTENIVERTAKFPEALAGPAADLWVVQMPDDLVFPDKAMVWLRDEVHPRTKPGGTIELRFVTTTKEAFEKEVAPELEEIAENRPATLHHKELVAGVVEVTDDNDPGWMALQLTRALQIVRWQQGMQTFGPGSYEFRRVENAENRTGEDDSKSWFQWWRQGHSGPEVWKLQLGVDLSYRSPMDTDLSKVTPDDTALTEEGDGPTYLGTLPDDGEGEDDLGDVLEAAGVLAGGQYIDSRFWPGMRHVSKREVPGSDGAIIEYRDMTDPEWLGIETKVRLALNLALPSLTKDGGPEVIVTPGLYEFRRVARLGDVDRQANRLQLHFLQRRALVIWRPIGMTTDQVWRLTAGRHKTERGVYFSPALGDHLEFSPWKLDSIRWSEPESQRRDDLITGPKSTEIPPQAGRPYLNDDDEAGRPGVREALEIDKAWQEAEQEHAAAGVSADWHVAIDIGKRKNRYVVARNGQSYCKDDGSVVRFKYKAEAQRVANKLNDEEQKKRTD